LDGSIEVAEFLYFGLQLVGLVAVAFSMAISRRPHAGDRVGDNLAQCCFQLSPSYVASLAPLVNQALKIGLVVIHRRHAVHPLEAAALGSYNIPVVVETLPRAENARASPSSTSYLEVASLRK